MYVKVGVFDNALNIKLMYYLFMYMQWQSLFFSLFSSQQPEYQHSVQICKLVLKK